MSSMGRVEVGAEILLRIAREFGPNGVVSLLKRWGVNVP
jgi:hypothetical protein